MNRVASFVALLAILVAISVIFYWVMADFVLPLFIAAFLVVVFRPLNDRIFKAVKGRRHLAAVITTILVMLIVLLPLVAVGAVAMLEGVELVNEVRVASSDNPLRRLRQAFDVEHSSVQEIKSIDKSYEELLTLLAGRDNEVAARSELRKLTRLVASLKKSLPDTSDRGAVDQISEQLASLADEEDDTALKEGVSESRTAFVIWKRNEFGGAAWAYITELVNPNEEEWRSITKNLFSRGQSLLVEVTSATSSTLARLLIGGIITVVAFFFFLCDGPSMIKTVMHLSPLDDRYENELLNEFVGVSRAVLLATLLSAAAQALLAGIGYYFAGVDSVVLLMVLTGMLALIPLIGTFGVWGPVCGWLYFVEGRPFAAVLLTIYCAAVVSTADNFIKPAVLHGQSRLHPLLALLSVLGGVKALGPIGILVGPMVVVFLQTLLSILQRELLHFEGVGNSAFATGAVGPDIDEAIDAAVDLSADSSESEGGADGEGDQAADESSG